MFLGYIQCLCVCSLGFAVLQMCMCERGHTHTVCIHKAHFPSSPHSAQLFCFHCTLVWLFCHKTFLLSLPDPILALASTYGVTHLSSPHQGIARPVGTTVQIMPGLHRIMDMHLASPWIPGLYHIRGIDYILNWGIITTLNRKLLKKQRLATEPLCFLWGYFFTMLKLLSVLEII